MTAMLPWHDPALPLPERMKLAEGRPLRRRMMAAMGQQDCGQCGYNCEDYSNAIFLKKEERLNLCVPGGKETARVLKALYAETRRAARHRPRRSPRRADASVAPAERGPLARPTRARSDVSLAHAFEQAGLGKGNLAHRA